MPADCASTQCVIDVPIPGEVPIGDASSPLINTLKILTDGTGGFTYSFRGSPQQFSVPSEIRWYSGFWDIKGQSTVAEGVNKTVTAGLYWSNMVPEPSTYALFILGFGIMAAVGKRGRSRV